MTTKKNILKKITVEMETYQYKRRRKQTGPRADRPDSDWKKQLQNLDKDQLYLVSGGLRKNGSR